MTIAREAVRMALRRLVAHRMRSLLTMLGVLIGTAAVIALVSIGKGASSDVTANIERLGTNLVTVNAGASFSGGTRSAGGSATTLTVDDASAIAELDGVRAVAPEAQTSGLVVAGDANTTTTIVGTTPAYRSVRAYDLQRGSFLTALAQEQRVPIAVLGSSVAEDLGLDAESAIGTTLTVSGLPVRVVGVLEGKGGSGPQSADDQVLVPLSVVQRTLTGSDAIRSIGVSLEDGIDQDAATAQLQALMRVQHGISGTASDDFTVTSQSQLVDTFGSVTETLTLLLAGVAAISLLVGGIGIMNMMLVGVQERTYEIGLRKALGARSRDILVQFVAEAVSVSVLGGLLGVVVGIAASKLTTSLAGWSTVLEPGPVVVAFAFSLLVGVVFGSIPAWKAARMDPVAALRMR
jgi:putative ABC transport system permease protein